MPFDLSLLTTAHLIRFVIAFGVAYGLIGLLLRLPVPALRSVKGKDVYYSGALVIGLILLFSYVVVEDLRLRVGLIVASLMTLIIGVTDENRPLSPVAQLFWQVVIVLLVLSWGWSIRYISQPISGGVIDLAGGHLGPFVLPGSILTIGWLLLLMNAVNWLDGSDGLAAGVGVIALLTLAGVALLPSVQDAQTLSLALVGAGVLLGFLLWNFPPAKVYLGTTGSWFVGLYIGLVAIIGGGKIVTTLLVLALPVIDLLLVILQRIISGRPPWQKDAVTHLHYRLRSFGWQPRTIALVMFGFTAVCGIAALVLQTSHKIAALVVAALFISLVVARLIIDSTGTIKRKV